MSQWFTYAYHPEANPTERVNRVLKGMIRSFLTDNQRVWDKHLFEFATAINSAVHDVTGYSPHELMFGSNTRGQKQG